MRMWKPVSVIFFLSSLLLFSCQKNDTDSVNGLPDPGDPRSFIRFTVQGMPQAAATWFALLSIESNTASNSIENKKVKLSLESGKWVTDKLELPKGDYQLSKFIVVNAVDTAKYATPKAGTIRDGQVPQTLNLAFSLTEKGIKQQAVTVLPVAENTDPADFGYEAMDFGLEEVMQVRATLSIRVGEVWYDSLPGNLTVKATSITGKEWLREIPLHKGMNHVRIPANYHSYRFSMNQWDVQVQKDLAGSEVQANMLVELKGDRIPKLLKEQQTFIENAGGLIPDTRIEYNYDQAGRLREIKSYQRSTQVSGLHLNDVYKFRYLNKALDSILRSDAGGQATGYSAFEYTGNRISSIANQSYDQFMGGVYTYAVNNNNEQISADYVFHNGHSMNYIMHFENGNKVSDQAISSTGAAESGVYEYDDYINPFHQLGWPDLFLSNSSKNNRTGEQKNYSGAIPQSVPYKYEYTYDADGYPSFVYISYKGFSSQQHILRIKKVFIYL